uniref:Chemokine interleukin-8-like domain-containing protein n=1 Tax=Otus sunia TaxID=257818 RepID=A0A8C8ASE0_9STRI
MRVHSCTGLASKASSPAQTLLRLSGASRLAGSPLAGELRCRCVRAVSEVIPPRRLARVELVAEGPHCAVPEVIATTKQGQTVCLSPSAPWVKLLVTRILNRYLRDTGNILSPFTGRISAWAPASA